MVFSYILTKHDTLFKKHNVVGLGMYNRSRHNAKSLSQFKNMSISGGAIPVRRLDNLLGGRVGSGMRPIKFMP